MKKILSIDGGGIRGIIPGQILVAIEKKLKHKTNNKEARIADYFDFFAGTSTGGILTCLNLCPSDNQPSKAKFSAEDAVKLYMEYGDEIFELSTWHRIRTGGGITDEKYSEKNLEHLLETYFKNIRLSQLVKPCIIPAYDIDRRSAHFFAQHDFATDGDGADFYIKDVCRATSAAPTYFEAAEIKSLSGVTYPLIDGGVFANNPALCAYSEVRNSNSNPVAKDMFIVSLGTGSKHKSYKYDKAKNWGTLGWIKPIIDIMMSGASETTDYHLKKIFSAGGNEDQYIRIQPSWMGNADLDMDNASRENLEALKEVGIETAQECSKEIDRIVEVLLNDDDNILFS